MFPHRSIILVLAALFAGGFSSAASACCGWGTGCGGCGTPRAAVVYAPPPPPPPVTVRTWTGGCDCPCGCRGFFTAAVPAAEPYPIAPAPIYVTNQGPDYTGPGIMVPYHTWTPAESYVTPGAYPYFGYRYRSWHRYGYGYRYGLHRPFFAPRARLAYHPRFSGRPSQHGPMPLPRPDNGRLYH